MTFTQSIKTCVFKYATFSGRASRSEYWWFILFLVLVNPFVSAVMIVLLFGGSPVGDTDSGVRVTILLSRLVSFLLFIPFLAATSRRLHDVGKSGWWQSISAPIVYFVTPWAFISILFAIPILISYIAGIFFLTKKGQPCDNKYGKKVVLTTKATFGSVWNTIKTHQGEEFGTIGGKIFTYEIIENSLQILPPHAIFNIHKSQFKKSFPYIPCANPTELQNQVDSKICGLSYVWAILNDKRIRDSF